MNNPFADSDFELDFSALLELPRLADAISPVTPGVDASPGDKHVVFELDENLYAVHSRQVAEAAGFFQITRLPFVPEWIAGITNLRGNLISAVDLRKLWRKTSAPPAKTKMLVLRSEKNNRTVAFVVDNLREMIALKPQEIEFSAADFASSFPTVFGRTTRSGQTIYLLDAENLFSSLSITDV